MVQNSLFVEWSFKPRVEFKLIVHYSKEKSLVTKWHMVTEWQMVTKLFSMVANRMVATIQLATI